MERTYQLQAAEPADFAGPADSAAPAASIFIVCSVFYSNYRQIWLLAPGACYLLNRPILRSLSGIRLFCRTNMHTADASTNQPIVDSSNLYVCRDSIRGGDAKAPFPRMGDRTTASDKAQTASFANTQTPRTETDNEDSTADSPEIPAWKRVLDVTLILLSLPLWLPVVLVIILWIKIASPGPIFFRQERIGFRGSRFLDFEV